MTYTAIFQNHEGKYTFTTFTDTHDRAQAWQTAHSQHADSDSRLVLLIDGAAVVRTFDDIVDIPW